MLKVDALAMFEVITVTQGSNQKILQSRGLPTFCIYIQTIKILKLYREHYQTYSIEMITLNPPDSE